MSGAAILSELDYQTTASIMRVIPAPGPCHQLSSGLQGHFLIDPALTFLQLLEHTAGVLEGGDASRQGSHECRFVDFVPGGAVLDRAGRGPFDPFAVAPLAADCAFFGDFAAWRALIHWSWSALASMTVVLTWRQNTWPCR